MSLEAKINELKIRVFDLSETVTEHRKFESEFASALAKALDLPEDMQADPQNYINAITDLRNKLIKSEGESEEEGDK
ncbi:MAG: hypothetical protein [Caudoviricetes sp.]|nr:MAG: hypothetical protein [Caudoviricetes sp.]